MEAPKETSTPRAWAGEEEWDDQYVRPGTGGSLSLQKKTIGLGWVPLHT